MRLAPFVAIREHTIYAPALRNAPQVVDLGSNRGAFSEEMQRRFGGRYLMVEANPALVKGDSRDGMKVVHAAVTAHDGTIRFNVAQNDEGSSVLTLPDSSIWDCVKIDEVDVPSMSLDRILRSPEVSSPVDLLKLDIEGSEVEVLLGVDLALLASVVRQVTVEFHTAPVFGFDLSAGVRRVFERLEGAGFLSLRFGRDLRDVLFLNVRLLRMGPLHRWLAKRHASERWDR